MAVQQKAHGRRPGGKTRLRRPSHDHGQPDIDWPLLSAQGRVLFYIALCPGRTIKEIARAMGLTERAVWGLVRTLGKGGMLHVHKVGRRHHYSVNLDAPLLHPTIQGLTLRPVMGRIAEQARRQPSEICLPAR